MEKEIKNQEKVNFLWEVLGTQDQTQMLLLIDFQQ